MSLRRIWTIAAWLVTIGALVIGCFLPFLRWHPQAHFDVLGVAWLFTNFPRLPAWVAFILLAPLALYCWGKAVFAESTPI